MVNARVIRTLCIVGIGLCLIMIGMCLAVIMSGGGDPQCNMP